MTSMGFIYIVNRLSVHYVYLIFLKGEVLLDFGEFVMTFLEATFTFDIIGHGHFR